VVSTPDPDELIINCYRLAHYYHQNPDLFVEMPLSKMNVHIIYTVRLINMQNEARGED
jgi:hypothetical protein